MKMSYCFLMYFFLREQLDESDDTNTIGNTRSEVLSDKSCDLKCCVSPQILVRVKHPIPQLRKTIGMVFSTWRNKIRVQSCAYCVVFPSWYFNSPLPWFGIISNFSLHTTNRHQKEQTLEKEDTGRVEEESGEDSSIYNAEAIMAR